MSLFPAYSDVSNSNTGTPGPAPLIVDCNPEINSTVIAKVTDAINQAFSSSEESFDKERKKSKRQRDSSSDNEKSRKRHKKKRKKHKKEKPLKGIEDIEKDLPYIFQSDRDLMYLKMDELPKKTRPRYNYPSKRLPNVYVAIKLAKKPKKKKRLRYFSKKVTLSGETDLSANEELSKTVEKLNKAVYENPSDVKKWLELVDFQCVFFKFQPIHYKTAAECNRDANLKKISILEKALSTNGGSEVLFKKWLSLALENYSFDETKTKLSNLTKDGDSLLFLLGRIMLTQQSMPHCTLPAVLQCYGEAVEKLQRARHLSSFSQDEQSLELFFLAATFLKQTGQSEMVWFIVKKMLSLNLSTDLPATKEDEKIVLELENKILAESDGVPLWHLWSRMEQLRAGHHFLPVTSSDSFPQRVPSSEQIIDLVNPVRRTSHFNLLVIFPLLANVPLLPRSHTLVEAVASQLTPWLFEDVEFHLGIALSPSPLFKPNLAWLAHVPKSLPPQFLRRLPGQAAYMEFIVKLFETVLSCLEGRQRTAIGVWYLRFLRWLDRLQALKIAQLPENRPKTKSVFREFLKKNENRDSILFYVEYALWEFENGDQSGSIKTLETLAASRGPVLFEASKSTKEELCHLYSTLCEVQIASGKSKEAKRTLQKLVSATSEVEVSTKMKHIAVEVIREDSNDELDAKMLPSIIVDWVRCYVWSLCLDGCFENAVQFVKNALEGQKPYIRERLFEVLILLLRNFQKDGAELAVAKEAILIFPLNPMFAAIVAEALVCGGGLWWTESEHLLHPPANVGAVALVCAILERQKTQESPDQRSRSTLRRLTVQEGRGSALLHRILLKLLLDDGDVTNFETARVLAVEACPWNKALYMDAVTLCPSQLMNITDVIVEKDLRIHATPDEIDAMRD